MIFFKVGPRKYKRRSKLGNRKDTWCLVEKVYAVMSGQSDTESCEDEPVPSVEEKTVQSIANQNDISYLPSPPSPAPINTPVKSYKLVNGKVLNYDQKYSKNVVSHGSKYSVSKIELPKKQCFVLKDGECTRTCPTVIYYATKTDSANASPLGEESKENDNPDEAEDQISVEDMDLTHIKIEPISEHPEFVVEHSYDNMCNIEYAQEGVEYYIPNNDVYATQGDIVLETANDNCIIETELVFDSDYVEEVGANIELSTEEMTPVYTETISCDICDEVFEDRKELMRHIQTMHIG